MARIEIRRVLAWAWFLGSLVGIPAFADDARIRIVSPVAGRQFAPGDKVSIVVEMASSLRATDGSVGLAGLGSVKAKTFSGSAAFS